MKDMSGALLAALEDDPGGLARLDSDGIARLAGEIRALVTATVAANGGHLASNLGLVELTIALHRAYDFSRDRLVFDVGHQCYVHKLLTGRRDRFATLRRRGGLSGFPSPDESDADPFRVGHASTSISSALGLALAYRFRRDHPLKPSPPDAPANARVFDLPPQERSPRVVAVIGDGALGGGLAFEAMNHAGQVRADLLVILNDNDMAISETVGAVGEFLERLRARASTSPSLRTHLEKVLAEADTGEALSRLEGELFARARAGLGMDHLFCALGFSYHGPVAGHDFAGLETALAEVRDRPGPRLLHVVTNKGQGYRPASDDPEAFHSPPPFSVERPSGAVASGAGYTEVFAGALARHAEADPRVLALTAAMPSGTGIREFARRFPDRFLDVGIAEAHGVTLAGALATAGYRPVVAMYSTFLQRGFDQLIHDIALQPCAPVVLAIDRAGLVGADGPTHHGVYDIAFLRTIPGFVLMAPRDAEELRRMLSFALTLDRPAAIRYPRGAPPPLRGDVPPDDATAIPAVADGLDDPGAERLPGSRTALALGRSEVLAAGGDGAVFAYGRMVAPAYAAARRLARSGGPLLTVVNARFASDFKDDPAYERLAALPVWVTVEDHGLAGGYGSAVAEWLADRGGVGPRLRRVGVPDRPIHHAASAELDEELGLDIPGLVKTFNRATRRGG